MADRVQWMLKSHCPTHTELAVVDEELWQNEQGSWIPQVHRWITQGKLDTSPKIMVAVMSGAITMALASLKPKKRSWESQYPVGRHMPSLI